MDRVVILGRAGAGKTTLAHRLGELTGSPVIVLDASWPHWQDSNVPEFRSLVAEAHASDKWISDGNFAVASFDIRLPRATLIIWVDDSRLKCSWRAIRRALKGDVHHGMRGLADVLKFIWRFDRINRPRIEEHIQAHGPDVPVMHLHKAVEVKAFLATLYPSG